jgi:hypothetical protein
VRKYLHAAQTGPDDVTVLLEAISPHIRDSDEIILGAFEELPFSSVRQLSHAPYLPKTMVYRQLSEKLGFTGPHLRWVPHIFSEANKATRVQCSQSVLTILREQQTRAWHDIVTLVDSGFRYLPDHKLIWLPSEEKVPDRQRVTIEAEK